MDIVQGLWLGSYEDAADLVNRNPEGIASVLDCRHTCEQNYRVPSGIDYLRLPLEDGEPIPERLFWQGIGFIRQHLNRGLLVHCRSGQSRSVTMVAACLVTSGQQTDMAAALKWIQSKRAMANPDPTVWSSAVKLMEEV
jgi:protein-tyrosine phosphatase